ncbi:hypothetical protein STAS_12243 [Striga asiatica]|uniref:Uncharacterized protein n=1 Tax=Striga asiatica TaxID=4170 RepID=A0A5A7PTG3_STRAF|nr:hypothetical protein STAS_12243 [Striga asiatica]
MPGPEDQEVAKKPESEGTYAEKSKEREFSFSPSRPTLSRPKHRSSPPSPFVPSDHPPPSSPLTRPDSPLSLLIATTTLAPNFRPTITSPTIPASLPGDRRPTSPANHELANHDPLFFSRATTTRLLSTARDSSRLASAVPCSSLARAITPPSTSTAGVRLL